MKENRKKINEIKDRLGIFLTKCLNYKTNNFILFEKDYENIKVSIKFSFNKNVLECSFKGSKGVVKNEGITFELENDYQFVLTILNELEKIKKENDLEIG